LEAALRSLLISNIQLTKLLLLVNGDNPTKDEEEFKETINLLIANLTEVGELLDQSQK